MTEGKRGSVRGLWNLFFSKSWPMWVGGILLAVGNICLFIVLKPWGASGGIANWGQNIFNSLGIESFGSEAAPLAPVSAFPYGLLCLTMLLGAFSSALFGKEFAIRIPPFGELVKGLVGGILMGIGAMVGKSCTIGGFFSGWPALSLGAVVFTVGLVIGVVVAIRYLLFEMEKFPKISSGKSASFLAASTRRASFQPLFGFLALIAAIWIAYVYQGDAKKILVMYTLIGFFFGFVCQRSRFCLVRALREPFMTGDSSPAIAAMGGILVSMFGFTVIKYMSAGGDASKEMMWVWPHFWVPALIGGIIFGLGMTVAGGCTVGSVWRAGEGQVKLWMSVIGMIIGLPLAGKYIATPLFYRGSPLGSEAIFPGMADSFYLPAKLGYGLTLLLFLVLIFLWYLFVKWNERTGKFTAV